MNEKERDPTMKRSHKVEKEADLDKLNQQFKVLQQEWDSYSRSNPRTLQRYSIDSKAMAKALQLLDSSPRNLMSSLQHKWSSSGGWKIRTNDLAKEEIRTERRALIESGRLKGRRLFEAEVETEMGLGGREKICNGWNGLVQESEVRSVSFYDSGDDHKYESGVIKELPVCFHCNSSSSSSSSPSSLCCENMERQVEEEGKKVLASVETRKVAYGGSGNGRSWMVVMGWFAIASIIYAICIIPMRTFGGYGDEHEMLLVPT